MNKEYNVLVSFTESKVIKIEAENVNDVRQKVQKLLDDGEHDDFKDTLDGFTETIETIEEV